MVEPSARRQQLQDETLAEFRRTMARAFALARLKGGPHHLEFTHHMVLHPLLKRGEASQREIADEIGVTSGRVTGLIDDLEAQGVVRRVRSPSDRRKMMVSLTARGRRTHVDTHHAMSSNMGRVFEGMSDEEIQTLRTLLSRLVPQIPRAPDSTPPKPP